MAGSSLHCHRSSAGPNPPRGPSGVGIEVWSSHFRGGRERIKNEACERKLVNSEETRAAGDPL